MKRFKIHNKISGLHFQVEGEALGPHQPEWGKHERWEKESQCTRFERDNALETKVVDGEVMCLIPKEYDIVEEDITVELNRKKVNVQAEQYLRETDWYIIREMDSGEPCPEDIKQKRAEARAKIVR